MSHARSEQCLHALPTWPKKSTESLKEYFLAAVQGQLQFEEFYALRDVSLTVERGDFYALWG